MSRSRPVVIAEAIAPERPAMVWNLVVHHADLHEALAVHPMPDRLWRPVAEALPPTSEALAAIDPYELFRAQFSRRSRAQLAAWSTGLPTAELDALGLFGPRDDDQPLPAPARS